MAKLSAHGYEVARLTKSMTLAHTDGEGFTDYKVVLSFRSDGNIMRNLTALNIHDTTYGASPHHTYGWKLYKKLSAPGKDRVAAMRRIAASWRDQAAEKGTLIDFREGVL